MNWQLFFLCFPHSFPTFKHKAGRLPCLGEVYVTVASGGFYFPKHLNCGTTELEEWTQFQKIKEELGSPSARVDREPPEMKQNGEKGELTGDLYLVPSHTGVDASIWYASQLGFSTLSVAWGS